MRRESSGAEGAARQADPGEPIFRQGAVHPSTRVGGPGCICAGILAPQPFLTVKRAQRVSRGRPQAPLKQPSPCGACRGWAVLRRWHHSSLGHAAAARRKECLVRGGGPWRAMAGGRGCLGRRAAASYVARRPDGRNAQYLRRGQGGPHRCDKLTKPGSRSTLPRPAHDDSTQSVGPSDQRAKGKGRRPGAQAQRRQGLQTHPLGRRAEQRQQTHRQYFACTIVGRLDAQRAAADH